jgi:hypothetical protein
VTGLWWIPFLAAVWLGVALGAGVRQRPLADPDRELSEMLATQEVSSLRARLHDEPSLVRSSRSTLLRNRLVLDLGDVELDAFCYRPASAPISRVLAIFYQSSVGWVIDTDGPAGRGRINAWLLQVRPLRR